jgi:integrase
MEPESAPRAAGGRLLERVRAAARTRHMSIRTEQAYVAWIRRFVLFHGKRHPSLLGVAEIRSFLSELATRGRVAASTQNQALSALLFLYRHVLEIDLPPIGEVVRARRPRKLPVVLTVREVASVLAELKGVHSLVGGLLYGSGLRLLEGLRLRVKDIDFARRVITIREPKGGRDRVGVLPERLIPSLELHLASVLLRFQAGRRLRRGVHRQVLLPRGDVHHSSTGSEEGGDAVADPLLRTRQLGQDHPPQFLQAPPRIRFELPGSTPPPRGPGTPRDRTRHPGPMRRRNPTPRCPAAEG